MIAAHSIAIIVITTAELQAIEKGRFCSDLPTDIPIPAQSAAESGCILFFVVP
jgi:hypothetical protein